MDNFIISELIGYIQTVLMQATILSLSKVEWTIKRLFITVAIIQIPDLVLLVIFDMVLLTIIVWALLLVLSYRLSYKQSWQKSILMGLGQYFMIMGLDYILIFVVLQLPGVWQILIFNNSVVSRGIGLVCWVLIFIFTKRFVNREYLPPLDTPTIKSHMLYLMIFSFFAAYNLVRLLNMQLAIENFYEIVIIISFLIFFVYSIAHMRNLTKTLIVKQQLESTKQELADYHDYTDCLSREMEVQELYANSLENMLDDMHGFRHDFGHMVDSINGYVEQKDFAGLESYMKTLTVKVITCQTTQIAANIKQIPLLYGILLNKILYAEMKGIRLYITIMCSDIDLKYCSDVDYSRMVGILLDNALEAAVQSEEKVVNFDVKIEHGKLVSTVMNTCDKEVDVGRIFECGYSTKSAPSGEGLYQIRKTQEKYRKMGYTIDIEPECSLGFFTQTLRI